MNNLLLTVINLKSRTQSTKQRLINIILLTLFGVVMYISQVIMSQLPNIEIVSLLIILVTRKFGYRALASVYVFVGLEILTYGISMWVINYLYVWAILFLVVLFVRKINNAFLYAFIAAVFGLFFGTLCSVPYFISGGFAFGISYIVSGLGFDLLHCGGNLLTVIILYNPLTKVLDKAVKTA